MRKEMATKLLFALKMSERIGIDTGIQETLRILYEYPSEPLVCQVLQNLLATGQKKESIDHRDENIIRYPRAVSLLPTHSADSFRHSSAALSKHEYIVNISGKKGG